MKKFLLVLILPALLVGAGQVRGEAEYERWQLDISYGTPDFVLLEDATGSNRLAWYLTYTVKNNTECDGVPLAVRIAATTDTNLQYRDSLDPLAQKALERATGKKYRNSLAMNRGTIDAGETIHGVACFGEIDPNWDTLNVRIAGLFDNVEKVDGKLFFEKKVLVLSFSRPGDEFGSAGDEITFKSKKWVIEGPRTEIPQVARD